MTNFSIVWKKPWSKENSTGQLKFSGCLGGESYREGLLHASFFAVSCKRKADVLFLLMPHYSGIRSLAIVGLCHFLWGFVPGAAQCVLDFTSTVALVV